MYPFDERCSNDAFCIMHGMSFESYLQKSLSWIGMGVYLPSAPDVFSLPDEKCQVGTTEKTFTFIGKLVALIVVNYSPTNEWKIRDVGARRCWHCLSIRVAAFACGDLQHGV